MENEKTNQEVEKTLSVRKCFVEAWKKYTSKEFLNSRKYIIVRTLAALLCGITVSLGLQYFVKVLLVVKVLKTVAPEELTFKNLIANLPVEGLATFAAMLLLSAIAYAFYKRLQSRLLRASYPKNIAAKERKFFQNFGRRFLLWLITVIPVLFVAYLLFLPTAFSAFSYYERENARLLNDVVEWSLWSDLAVVLVATLAFSLLFSITTFCRIAQRIYNQAFSK